MNLERFPIFRAPAVPWAGRIRVTPCPTKVFQVVKKKPEFNSKKTSVKAWERIEILVLPAQNVVFFSVPRPGTPLMSKSSNLLLNLEAHAAGRPNLISPPSSLWGPGRVGSCCVSSASLPPFPGTRVSGRSRGLSPRLTLLFFVCVT